MNDIVIDTNVFVHTNNPGNHFYRSAGATLEKIRGFDLCICVDDVFSLEDSKNTSVIGHEYIKHIRTGTLAYAFLLERLMKNKIVQVFKKDYNEIKRKLNRKIIAKEMSNPHDIVFIIVAFGSNNKLLVSNDYNDFNDKIRKYISDTFLVSILDSDEYVLKQNQGASSA
jgi:hypothetical protein